MHYSTTTSYTQTYKTRYGVLRKFRWIDASCLHFGSNQLLFWYIKSKSLGYASCFAIVVTKSKVWKSFLWGKLLKFEKKILYFCTINFFKMLIKCLAANGLTGRNIKKSEFPMLFNWFYITDVQQRKIWLIEGILFSFLPTFSRFVNYILNIRWNRRKLEHIHVTNFCRCCRLNIFMVFITGYPIPQKDRKGCFMHWLIRKIIRKC